MKEKQSRSELERMIAGTIAAYPEPKQRWQAMRAIQWRLVDKDGRSVCLGNNFKIEWCAFDDGMVFDGRDNEEMKIAYYSAVLKTPMSVKILPQIVCAC